MLYFLLGGYGQFFSKTRGSKEECSWSPLVINSLLAPFSACLLGLQILAFSRVSVHRIAALVTELYDLHVAKGSPSFVKG